MKKNSALGLIFVMFLVTGCSSAGTGLNPRSSSQISTANPLQIVTSFYPLAEIAQKVGGKLVRVKNLVPAGAEPHDYEPTPQDVVSLNQADLVVYNGAGFEPWVDRIIPDLQKSGVKTLDMADLFKGGNDPHVWMDPVNYIKELQTVEQKLAEIDPQHQTEYQKNAAAFQVQLQDLNNAYANGFKNCKLHEFVTNHAAFAYLSNRYHLNMIAIAGFSPDSEPSPKIMTDLVNLIKAKNIHYLLTESLVSPKIADTLAKETGTKTLVLNPLEGLTDQELAQGKNYITVMKDNLKNLQTALECE